VSQYKPSDQQEKVTDLDPDCEEVGKSDRSICAHYIKGTQQQCTNHYRDSGSTQRLGRGLTSVCLFLRNGEVANGKHEASSQTRRQLGDDIRDASCRSNQFPKSIQSCRFALPVILIG
jgi:hypothetical protein